MSSRIAVIGGTGMDSLFVGDSFRRIERNQYDSLFQTRVFFTEIEDPQGKRFFFIDRHRSTGQYRLPHQLDHRIYLHTLWGLGVTTVLATSAVGGIGIEPGTLVAPDDYFDVTGRSYTFAEAVNIPDSLRYFRSQIPAFCPQIGFELERMSGVRSRETLGCCIAGPRYETRREVRFMESAGVRLLGMPTAIPEAILCRELGMHYVVLCCVTNTAGEDQIDPGHVCSVFQRAQQSILDIFLEIIKRYHGEQPMRCHCWQQKPVFDLR